MTHFASAFDLVAACKASLDGLAARTIHRRKVTCGDCIRALHRAADIAQYRFDHGLCINVLTRHARRRGNYWLAT